MYPIGQQKGIYQIVSFSMIDDDKDHLIARCQCGQLFDITFKQFENGIKFSCGCENRPKVDDDLKHVNKRFGNWTVKGSLPYRSGNKYLLCTCVCGKEKEVALSSLIQGKSSSCGCSRKKKIEEVNFENTGRKPGRPRRMPDPDISPYLQWCRGQMAAAWLRARGLPSTMAEVEAYQGSPEATEPPSDASEPDSYVKPPWAD